ncbi:MAG: hypothetical protein QOH93_3589 [Chloroflexia bacterium]|jgi:hypothetical protein|nr:hypothetical protein [Chloroflexia bacterium]
MSLMERDEYAARFRRSQGRRNSAGRRVLLLWLVWLPLTVIGVVLGRQLGLFLDDSVAAGGVAYFGLLLLRGAIVGAVAGGLQAVALWDFLHLRGWLLWVGITAAGWAARGVVLYYIGGPVVDAAYDWGGASLPIIAGVTGLVGGLVLGTVQTLVVRRTNMPVEPVVVWALACAGGAALGRVLVGFGMNFDAVNSLLLVDGLEALGLAFITSIPLADGIRRRMAATEAAMIERAAEREAQLRAVAEPGTIVGVNEWVDVGHGISLCLSGVDIGDKITWHLTARNNRKSQARVSLDPHKLRMSDSTRKMYRISGLHLGGAVLAPRATTHLEVEAELLSYAPIPTMATHLDLIYNPASDTAYAFRQPLPATASR